MSRTVSATEARVHLGEHLHRVEDEKVITVQHDGDPEGVVVSISEYQRLLNDQDQKEDWWELARRAREEFHRQLGDRKTPAAATLIREGREERRVERSVIQPEPGDWKAAFANVRARMHEEVGDLTIDTDEIIRILREERVAELLDDLR